MNNDLYRVYANLNHPKRVFGFTLDDVVISVIGGALLALSAQKVLVILFWLISLALLKRLKKNKGPRFLFVLAYWKLPRFITQFFLSNLPDSSKRFWKA